MHRALIDYVRARAVEGAPASKVAREVRARAQRGFDLLEQGLGDYGIKEGRVSAMPASDPLTTLLDGHVAVAEAAGSPFYAVLLALMRDDAAADGPVRVALRGLEHDRIDEWDAFRILAGVHRMVLAGDATSARESTSHRRARRRRRRSLAGDPGADRERPRRAGRGARASAADERAVALEGARRRPLPHLARTGLPLAFASVSGRAPV